MAILRWPGSVLFSLEMLFLAFSKMTHSPHFLPSGPQIDPSEAQTNRIPLAASLKDLQCCFFKEHNFFHISCLLSLQEAINKRREETLMSASQDLPSKEKEEIGREVIPSEGKATAQLIRALRKALFGWSWVLQRL